MIGAIYAAEGSSAEMLLAVGREFSPRIEVCGPREITLDLAGLRRLFGDTRTIAEEVRRTAADRGMQIRVAIAGTRTAARLLAHHRAGITVIEPGAEPAALASLPMALLTVLTNDPNQNDPSVPNVSNDPNAPNAPNVPNVLVRWGLRTLGDFAELPADDVASRLGQNGVRWQRLARGEDVYPLLPAVPEERFEHAFDLEWPIEGLEPLSFALGRVLEPLSAHLERRGRGVAVLHTRLHLVTRVVHERSLHLPAPIRDARTLRTLALLDLEAHPPPAAIDRVVVAVEPTPERVVQFSLLTRPLPSPEQFSTLMARLAALMGEGRCGSPAEVGSWQPGAFAMKTFAPVGQVGRVGQVGQVGITPPALSVALRRFRIPIPVRVRMEQDKPRRVDTDRRGLSGGRVETCAGPWRTSGGWWADKAGKAGSWDRDEWDVALGDGTTYRLFRDRHSHAWFLDGIVD